MSSLFSPSNIGETNEELMNTVHSGCGHPLQEIDAWDTGVELSYSYPKGNAARGGSGTLLSYLMLSFFNNKTGSQ